MTVLARALPMTWTRVGPAAVEWAAGVLGLPRAARLVLLALHRARRALTVSEILRLARVSERSARAALALLVPKGLLVREVVTTPEKRLAYAYRLPAPEAFAAAVVRDVAARLDDVERAARELFGVRLTGRGVR